MRVMVTGSGGTLGREVIDAGHDFPGLDILPMPHAEMSLTDPVRMARVLGNLRPDVIINCAGLIRGRTILGREMSASEMMAVNAVGPHMLAEIARDYVPECRVLQVSTDCVFSGFQPAHAKGYTELDSPDTTDIYGRSKAAGELLTKPDLTVRCSFVGIGEHGLLSWLMRQCGTVPGYNEALWNGMTSIAVARVLLRLALNAQIVGLLHIHSSQVISKAQLLTWLRDAFGLGLLVHDATTPPSHRVNRALWSMREDAADTVGNIPPIKEQIAELVDMWKIRGGRRW
jgi:dTDP-4-dehydrorhamnose reductase